MGGPQRKPCLFLGCPCPALHVRLGQDARSSGTTRRHPRPTARPAARAGSPRRAAGRAPAPARRPPLQAHALAGKTQSLTQRTAAGPLALELRAKCDQSLRLARRFSRAKEESTVGRDRALASWPHGLGLQGKRDQNLRLARRTSLPKSGIFGRGWVQSSEPRCWGLQEKHDLSLQSVRHSSPAKVSTF